MTKGADHTRQSEGGCNAAARLEARAGRGTNVPITLCECCELRPAEVTWRRRYVCRPCRAWLKARVRRRRRV